LWQEARQGIPATMAWREEPPKRQRSCRPAAEALTESGDRKRCATPDGFVAQPAGMAAIE
jgi:hypothetical protein